MSKKMKLVCIVGPFRGKNSWEVERNIRRAEELGMRVAEMGAIPIIPHTMYRFWNGTLNDEFWLECCRRMLDMCGAVVVTDSWENSSGTRAEIRRAEDDKLVFYSEHTVDMIRLQKWIDRRNG